MTPGIASILFDFRGQRYEYDGGLPDAVADAVADRFDERGFWVGGYPDTLAALGKDPEDELPTARWEIEHIGGTVIEILGARDNGAIHFEDWKRPRIH
jgi:hypothetical protein